MDCHATGVQLCQGPLHGSHCLRYLDGYFYNFFLASLPGSYEMHVVRSKDLIHWELSQLTQSCGPRMRIGRLLTRSSRSPSASGSRPRKPQQLGPRLLRVPRTADHQLLVGQSAGHRTPGRGRLRKDRGAVPSSDGLPNTESALRAITLPPRPLTDDPCHLDCYFERVVYGSGLPLIRSETYVVAFCFWRELTSEDGCRWHPKRARLKKKARQRKLWTRLRGGDDDRFRGGSLPDIRSWERRLRDVSARVLAGDERRATTGTAISCRPWVCWPAEADSASLPRPASWQRASRTMPLSCGHRWSWLCSFLGLGLRVVG